MEYTTSNRFFNGCFATNENDIYIVNDEQQYPFTDGTDVLQPFEANGSNVFPNEAIQAQVSQRPVKNLDFSVNFNSPMMHHPFADTISAMFISVRSSNLTTASANTDTDEQRWENLKPIVHRLYIEEQILLEDVRIIMLLVYHFQKTRSQCYTQFGKEGWEKFGKNDKTQDRMQVHQQQSAGIRIRQNKTRKHHQQQTTVARTRQNKKAKATSPLSDTLFSRLASQILAISTIASPDICLLQETIIKSVHHIAFGLFESEGWTSSDLFSITAADETTGLSSIWQSLSDQAFGATRLARMSPNNLGQGVRKLHGIFEQMESTMMCLDPAMLVKFWRMCRYIYELCAAAKDFTILSWFFQHYGEMTRSKLRPGSETYPVFQICAALYKILQKNPSELLNSLRIGYLKSIHSLKSWIGGDHATVLAMWSNYLKHWDSDTLHHASLRESYQLLLDESDREYGPNSESSLSILDRFTYLAHYNLKEASLAKNLALSLVKRSSSRMPVAGGLQWCMDAQYFSFGCKVIAIVSAQEGLHVEVQQSYRRAITVLEWGDLECRIRAEMLRGELAEYLKTLMH